MAHTAVTTQNWDVMGMDMNMNTHGMGNAMGYNDMFASNMANYPTVMKPPGDLGPAPYVPNGPTFPPATMNMLSPQYVGDPRVYGQ